MKAQGATEDTELEWALLRAETGSFPDLEKQLKAWIDGGHAQSNLIMETLVASLVGEGRYRTAGSYLMQWLKSEPDNAVAHFWLGMAREKVGNLDLAREAYSKCLELEPERVDARERLVLLCLFAADIVAARPHLKELKRTAPDRPKVWLLLAVMKMHEGQLEDAERLFARVLETHPNHAIALYQRGIVAMRKGRPAEQEQWLRRALTLEPDLNAARYALYQCLVGQPGRREEATAELAAYKKSLPRAERLVHLLDELESQPMNLALLLEAGELLLDRRELALARQLLHRVLSLQPGHEKARELLARMSKLSDRN